MIRITAYLIATIGALTGITVSGLAFLRWLLQQQRIQLADLAPILGGEHSWELPVLIVASSASLFVTSLLTLLALIPVGFASFRQGRTTPTIWILALSLMLQVTAWGALGLTL